MAQLNGGAVFHPVIFAGAGIFGVTFPRGCDIIAAKRLLYFDFSPFAPRLCREPQKVAQYTAIALRLWYIDRK